MVGWPWWPPCTIYRDLWMACVYPSTRKGGRRLTIYLALALPSSFLGVTMFSLLLNCFSPSSLITPSCCAWLHVAQPNKWPAAHAEVEGRSTDLASSSIRRVVREMDVEDGSWPVVHLQSTRMRAASSPCMGKLISGAWDFIILNVCGVYKNTEC
jgi:hypothetical protein